jgi:hypothetical protein
LMESWCDCDLLYLCVNVIVLENEFFN